MPTVVALEDIRLSLPELLDSLALGQEVILTRREQPVAKLVRTQTRPPRPGPGLGKGLITIVADDDEYLQDFAEYMP